MPADMITSELIGHGRAAPASRNRSGLLVICFFAFISLGMPDGLLGVAWPSVRRDFGLPVDTLGVVMIIGTAGYMASSFFCGPLVRWCGIGGLLSLSCAATGLTLLVFGLSPWWPLIMVFAILLGAGAGAIDSALNTYVAKYHTARAMQWMHSFFGVGITLGPLIMTTGLTASGRWQLGYLIVGGAQLVLAGAFFLTRGRWRGIRWETESSDGKGLEAPMRQTLRTSGCWLSMILFFFYVGLEIGLGLWAFSFLTEARNVGLGLAGFITGSYWGMFTVSRMLAGWYSHHLPVRRVLHLSLGLAAIGLVLLLIDAGPSLAVVGFGVTGFAVAPIFPALISDTEARVAPRHHANTIGIQIAAAGLGAALVPALAGFIARHAGLGILPGYMLTTLGLLWASLLLARPRVVQTAV
jgi:fucose permease